MSLTVIVHVATKVASFFWNNNQFPQKKSIKYFRGMIIR